jgi:hypothetical protein
MQHTREKDITKKTLGRKLLEGKVGLYLWQIGEKDITKKTRKKVIRRRGKIVVCSKHGKMI